MTSNDLGKVKLKATLHEGVKPGTVFINEGWEPRDFAEGSYQELTGTPINPAQEAVYRSMGQIQGILVEVKKAEQDGSFYVNTLTLSSLSTSSLNASGY